MIKAHVLHFVCIHMDANAACYLLQTMQKGFGLGWCICKKHNVICVVCIHNSSCGVLSASSLFFRVKPFSFIIMAVTFSLGRPKARSICSIFPLCMESKALEKSTNWSVSLRFFAQTPSKVKRIVRIYEVDLFL